MIVKNGFGFNFSNFSKYFKSKMKKKAAKKSPSMTLVKTEDLDKLLNKI